MNKKEFILNSKKKHGDEFDYSEVPDVNIVPSKVYLTCSKGYHYIAFPIEVVEGCELTS